MLNVIQYHLLTCHGRHAVGPLMLKTNKNNNADTKTMTLTIVNNYIDNMTTIIGMHTHWKVNILKIVNMTIIIMILFLTQMMFKLLTDNDHCFKLQMLIVRHKVQGIDNIWVNVAFQALVDIRDWHPENVENEQPDIFPLQHTLLHTSQDRLLSELGKVFLGSAVDGMQMDPS